ncbi:hypothetical protein QBC34DRAFT_436823 [Podospora aff. communis PSN243]|uniref:Uncharacterized protein n=1 Tax=Podospora aff. communis PSN243 TaxID=3040156 RepID=A0AAV9GSC5_9PEZI|nr:hypothetical protein QBC34DRAFT_436823 [Podospora aff. communis PSN243]
MPRWTILSTLQTVASALLGWAFLVQSPAPGQTTKDKIRAELCAKGLRQRAQTWRIKGKSWTDEITHILKESSSSDAHYITCSGDHSGSPCLGRWSRRLRRTTVPGLHCVFGGWVSWDGNTVVAVQVTEDMTTLRQLWAEHVLAQQLDQGAGKREDVDVEGDDTSSITSVVQVHAMLDKVLANSAANRESGKKAWGRGSGGSSGVTSNGTILKRDTRDRDAALREDRCDLDLGGIWERGDVDAWMPFFGWSALISRDGRWRPGYHLNMLLANWTTVIDYGLTRPVYRQRKLSWMEATELAWADPPLDIPGEYVRMVRQDAATMAKKELQRSCALKAEVYKADDFGTVGSRNVAMQDRAGQAIAYHGVGEGLDTPRGIVATTAMCALNDIQDYERDVFAGETNNIARGLTSNQQVVDLAAWFLKAVLWAVENKDYDLSDVLMGSAAIFMVMWRYNTPKLARYDAVSVGQSVPGTAPELDDVEEMVRLAEFDRSLTYGELYCRAEAKAGTLYVGCCCAAPPEGHEASDLLAKAMDDKGDDNAEHRLLVACVALNNGAQSGDVRCDCGLDLLLYESFVRFFDPDMGIVARVHYRSDITKLGNFVTE